MSMPQIPDGKNRPSLSETIIDLLESIALEEMAISHILNAEGERLQEIVKKYRCDEVCSNQLNSLCKPTQDIINSLIMKEWLLYTKLGTVISINVPDNQCCCPKENWQEWEPTPPKFDCCHYTTSTPNFVDENPPPCTCKTCIHENVCKNKNY